MTSNSVISELLEIGTVVAVLLVIIIAVSGFFWLVGTVWNHRLWLLDGKPSLNNNEQLLADILVSQGHTVTAARRKILGARKITSDKTEVTNEMFAELEADLSNPDLGPLLRRSPMDFAAYMLSKPDNDPLKQDYIRRYL